MEPIRVIYHHEPGVELKHFVPADERKNVAA